MRRSPLEMVLVIVVMPTTILNEILDHAGSHPDKEIIGVFLGKSLGKVMEITDIVSYPEASYPERAVLPGTFLYGKIGDEIRERDYSVNVKGYYHSHPPDVFPLKFSHIDFRQYEDLQNIFARKQPFLAIIVNPVTRAYVFLTLDVDRREIQLEPFSYENLIWVDYAVKRFSDGFTPYRIDPQTGERALHPKFQSLLDNLVQKYDQKKIVTIMFRNALAYKKAIQQYADESEDAQNLLEMFEKARTLYYSEDFIGADKLLEQFIKEYVESLSEKIEEIKETIEKPARSSQLVTKINKKMYYLVKAMEKVFPQDVPRIAGVMLDIKRKIDECGEPFCYIQIDKTMKLTLPSTGGLTEEHLEYVETIVNEQIIEHLGQDTLEKMEQYLESKGEKKVDRITFINRLLNSYFQRYYDSTEEQLHDEINEALILKYIKKGYSMKGVFFENCALAEDNLKEIFGDNFQEVLPEIENFLEEKIRKDIGTEPLQELLHSIKTG